MANEINLEKLLKYCETKGLKLTSKWYRELAKDDKVSPVIKGNVDALDALARLAIYYQGVAVHRGDTSLRDEQRRKMKADATKAELALQELQGSLIRREEVAQEFESRTYIIKADLLALPKRLARWPDAKAITAKYLRQLMKTYSRKTGVLRGAKT